MQQMYKHCPVYVSLSLHMYACVGLENQAKVLSEKLETMIRSKLGDHAANLFHSWQSKLGKKLSKKLDGKDCGQGQHCVYSTFQDLHCIRHDDLVLLVESADGLANNLQT